MSWRPSWGREIYPRLQHPFIPHFPRIRVAKDGDGEVGVVRGIERSLECPPVSQSPQSEAG